MEWITRLTDRLGGDSRGLVLRKLCERLIQRIVKKKLDSSGDDFDQLVSEELEERIWNWRSEAFAAELIRDTRENDPNLDHWLFPDGFAETVLVSDGEILQKAEEVLNAFESYIAAYPDYDVIHPSDYSYPQAPNKEKERERIINDFAWMLRQWRDGFLAQLIKDGDTPPRASDR